MDRDKSKESVHIEGAEKELFGVLCNVERKDDDSFEVDMECDDDENISIASSCVGDRSANGNAEVDDVDGPADGDDDEGGGGDDDVEDAEDDAMQVG